MFWEKIGQYLLYPLKNRKGVAESSLVLIPLLILFLTIMQIAISSLSRKSVEVALSGQAENFAINSDLNGSAVPLTQESNLYPYSNQIKTLDLPTGAKIIITKRSSNFPRVTPLLVGGDHFDSYGLSVK